MSDNVFEGSCYCSAVKVIVNGAPLAVGYCHCKSCRKWHSAPVNAWAVWQESAVTFEGETVCSTTNEASGRISCAKCGGSVANAKRAECMMVVYAMTLLGSGLEYKPAFHLYYPERVLDMADGLPKYVNEPEAFGGSGETLDEPKATVWLGER